MHSGGSYVRNVSAVAFPGCTDSLWKLVVAFDVFVSIRLLFLQAC
jgi:hypothetical protein